MTWTDAPIDNDDEGNPMFKGAIRLMNDNGEELAAVVWFFDEGPFYAYAVDLADPETMMRIGPCSTLEGAKATSVAVIESQKR